MDCGAGYAFRSRFNLALMLQVIGAVSANVSDRHSTLPAGQQQRPREWWRANVSNIHSQTMFISIVFLDSGLGSLEVEVSPDRRNTPRCHAAGRFERLQ